MKSTSNSLVTLLTTSLIHEIHIAKGFLKSNGIESYIFDENIMSTIGTAFVEGYKLKVSSEDFDKSKQLLEEMETDNN